MKYRLYSILGIFSIALLISCRDCYYIESDLHGIWQVTSIEKLSTGDVSDAQGKLYYSFQRSMIMLSHKYTDAYGGITRYISHFDIIEPDSIVMGVFRVRTTGEGNFVNQETKIPLEKLHKFGFYRDSTIFHMQQSRQKLVLTSDSACIILRRY